MGLVNDGLPVKPGEIAVPEPDDRPALAPAPAPAPVVAVDALAAGVTVAADAGAGAGTTGAGAGAAGAGVAAGAAVLTGPVSVEDVRCVLGPVVGVAALATGCMWLQSLHLPSAKVGGVN